MTRGPQFTKHIQSLPSTVPFVGPETQERSLGAPFAARLGANENVFGPSPKALKAMEKASKGIWKYADPEAFELRMALAEHHGVKPENIMIGEGIDGLLGNLVRLFVEKDTPVATSLGAYPTFNYHVAGFGGALHTVPYKDNSEDPDALAACAEAFHAKVMYFANPDNPMGSFHDASVVQRLIEKTPENTLLCLDEAYIEFAPQGTAPEIDVSNPNVIRMRTFSKAYGMAGARVGYAIGEANLISAFNKVRNHFGMNRVALAGALAALQDQEYLKETISKVNDAKDKIASIAMENDLVPLVSATNFVTIDCGSDADFARAVVQGLAKHNVFIRMPFVAPHNRCVRVSAGTDSDLELFAETLPKVLEEIR